MSKIAICTDSHSGLMGEPGKELGVFVLPCPFYINEVEYLDGISLSREKFFEEQKKGSDIKTSQPSPKAVTDLWDELLKDYDEIVYIPLSSGLSGGCQTAKMLADDEPYEDKVFVVDNGCVSAPQENSINYALEMINAGLSAKEIAEKLETVRDQMIIYIAVDDLTHLKKGGRISSTSAFIGNLLNIKPILKFSTETLSAYAKSRGFKKARQEMIAAIKNHLDTDFKEAFLDGRVTLMAAGSASEETTSSWVTEISAAFPDLQVLYRDLSLGLCCHIGENGLGIALAVKPKF